MLIVFAKNIHYKPILFQVTTINITTKIHVKMFTSGTNSERVYSLFGTSAKEPPANKHVLKNNRKRIRSVDFIGNYIMISSEDESRFQLKI